MRAVAVQPIEGEGKGGGGICRNRRKGLKRKRKQLHFNILKCGIVHCAAVQNKRGDGERIQNEGGKSIKSTFVKQKQQQ